MSDNPIQYTSRTYNTILNDIDSDTQLKDTPNFWKRMIAGIGDVLSMYENAIANQSYLRTAFTRQAVIDLCRLIDYYLTPQSTSSGNLIYYFNPDTVVFPKVISAANLKARSQGALTVSSRVFEAREGVTVSAFSEGFTTNFAADNNLDVARVYTTGEKVRVSTDNTLPSPLQSSTDYYVIYISDTEIRLAESLVDAYNANEITLTDDGVGNHTVTLYSTIVESYQQETKDTETIGTSDGTTAWQEFDLPDIDILEDTLTLTINSQSWVRVDSLIDSISTDRHFLLIYNTDNSSFIRFGDGTFGAIPGNFDIFADYSVGGNSESNISTVNFINIYGGSDADILGVSNPAEFTGGSNPESIENAKILAPILLKARDRFVTSSDGEALSLSYGGIIRVKVNKNVYGLLSCSVPIVPSGGGAPSAGLKSGLQSFLISRSILDSIDVRVIDPTYSTITPIVQVKILTDYTFANVKPFVLLALRLLFSEVTIEIKTDYETNGVESAVSIINTKWSTSFAVDDYSQIIELIENVTPTDFGLDFQESDVLGYIDNFVFGVDYVTISSPAFPISIGDDEISTDNVLTGNVTEIP